MYHFSNPLCVSLLFQSSDEQDSDLPEALPQSSEAARNSTKFGNNVGFTVVMPEGESHARGLSFHNNECR